MRLSEIIETDKGNSNAHDSVAPSLSSPYKFSREKGWQILYVLLRRRKNERRYKVKKRGHAIYDTSFTDIRF